MKKGIEVWTEYDELGRWTLVIEKKRGKLTPEDIMRAAREWECDHYLLYLNCYSEDFEMQFVNDGGDRAVLYRAEDLRGSTDTLRYGV